MTPPAYRLVERKGHWLTGCLRQFRNSRLEFLCENARIAPMVRFRLGHKSVYFLSDPDLIREMLVTQHRHLVRESTVRSVLAKTIGQGLLTSDGDYWKRQRRMIAPALHRQQVFQYVQLMAERTAAMASAWQDGQAFDLEQALDRLTLGIVTAALFNIDSSRHADLVAETITALQSIATRQIAQLVQWPAWVPTPDNRQQQALSRRLRAVILAEIQARRQARAEGSDLLTTMLQAVDAETGERMTDEEVCDEAITLYLAGYDTTALTVTFCCYELARQPEVQSRLQAELDRVLGGRLPGVQDLERLEYTRMLFKETLRLYPPAYFAVRQVAQPIELGGHRIPVGAVLMASTFAMHRNPDLWDDPDRFNPERFADDAERTWHKFKYFPFGGGPRICIGNQFAMLEGPLILATVAQRYRFELLEPGQRVELEPQITLGPKGGMPLRVRQRMSPAPGL